MPKERLKKLRNREVAGHYEEIADWFDASRPRTLMEREYLELALKYTGAAKERRVLDLGCGAGEPLARFFIEAGAAVTGIDLSPRMIELCRARFPDHDWRVGDIRGLQVGRRFDIVLAWDSFFHLDATAQRAMFPVFRDHAAPNGVLIFTSGPKDGEVWGTMQARDFYYASLAPEEYRALLADNGFEVLLHRVEDPACGGHTVWVAARK